jgi:hypothetical protein
MVAGVQPRRPWEGGLDSGTFQSADGREGLIFPESIYVSLEDARAFALLRRPIHLTCKLVCDEEHTLQVNMHRV